MTIREWTLGAIGWGLAGGFTSLWWGVRRKLRRIQNQPRPRPPIEQEQDELDYVGGELEIGERAIVDAYVRMLDELWRVRTGLYQASPLYVIEKAGNLMSWTEELTELIGFWQDEEPALRWDVMMRAVKIRATWSGSHQKAVRVVEPLPWEFGQRFEPPSITCPICFMTSYNPNDIKFGWCGKCMQTTSIGTCGYDFRPQEVRAALAEGNHRGRTG